MSCRHRKDALGFIIDPACGSYASPEKRMQAVDRYRTELPSPDNSQYEILDHSQIGPLLVLKVKYDSCSNCSGEAEKVMVFRSTVGEALRWKVIDPHFRLTYVPNQREAPPPLARFMPSDEGWLDACDYARSKADPRPF